MKLTKEDIKTYGTEKERKLLEADKKDTFIIPDPMDKEAPYIVDPAQYPDSEEDDNFSVADPMDKEEHYEEDDTRTVTIPMSLLEDISDFIMNAASSDQGDQLLDALEKIMLEYGEDDQEDRTQQPWQKY